MSYRDRYSHLVGDKLSVTSLPGPSYTIGRTILKAAIGLSASDFRDEPGMAVSHDHSPLEL
jgi:hypothetical protein